MKATKASVVGEGPGRGEVSLLPFRGFMGSLWKPQVEKLELSLYGWVGHAPSPGPSSARVQLGPLGASWWPPAQRLLSAELVMPGVKESQAWVAGVQKPCLSVGLWYHPHTSVLQVLSPDAIASGWQVDTLPLRVAKQGESADLGNAEHQWGTPVRPPAP